MPDLLIADSESGNKVSLIVRSFHNRQLSITINLFLFYISTHSLSISDKKYPLFLQQLYTVFNIPSFSFRQERKGSKRKAGIYYTAPSNNLPITPFPLAYPYFSFTQERKESKRKAGIYFSVPRNNIPFYLVFFSVPFFFQKKGTK